MAVALLLCSWGGVASAEGVSTPHGTAGIVRLTSTKPLETCLKSHGVKLPKAAKFSKSFKRPRTFKLPKNSKPPKNFKPSKKFKPGEGFKPTKASKKLEAALKACGVKGGAFFGGAPSSTATASALKAYLGCLSDHGVKVSKKDRKKGILTGLSSEKKFTAANKVCSVLLPSTTTTGT